MSKATLSPTMTAALAACKAGGSLWRWPGGFWVARVKQPSDPSVPPDPNWGTQTIYALIDRGAVTVAGRSGTYGGGSYINQVAPAATNHQS